MLYPWNRLEAGSALKIGFLLAKYTEKAFEITLRHTLELLCLVLFSNLFISAVAASPPRVTTPRQSPSIDIILDPEVDSEDVIPETWQRQREERYQNEQQRRQERYQLQFEDRQEELWDRQRDNWNDYQQEQRERTQQRLDEWNEQRREQLRRY
ncbi:MULTISPECIES: hypothetical protein [unclassified Leptolyngbya]|uniref:hypothetical protein n=1 Tax=unclassified Leptolyngbya TaxID=2650499 RepID=UPI001684E0AD|nr:MULTISPECIES: hypothetical protein [unclassified Leptolyngbya]MBD1909825.1 hypothetical protein [Leptolyngbya sp. FACHB-8]MBD2158976.1 hypothetical protein [Leptolyngbya sp. FACHB-16]